MGKINDLRAKVDASDADNKSDILADIDSIVSSGNGNAEVTIDHAFIANMCDELREGLTGETLDALNSLLKRIVIASKPIVGLDNQVISGKGAGCN